MSRSVWHRGVFVVSLAVALVAAFAAQAAAGTNTTFSGQATVVKGKVAGIPIALVDTGPVAAEGGELEETLLCYPGAGCAIDVPDLTNGMLGARVLHAAVVAQGNKSHAEASVAEFNLANVAGNNISAEFLQAEAEARCVDGKAFVSGTAEVAELTINGQTIDVTGEVNQRVDLPGGGFVIINEQIASAEAGKGDITVRALHIVIPGLLGVGDTDLVIAEAHADIVCAQVQGGCRGSRVTGGGWYTWLGNRVHFALAARDGLSDWGHLLYQDKAAGVQAKGNPTSAQIVPNGKNDGTGTVEGTASGRANGQDVGFFIVEFVDGGEPGRSDKFAIQLLTQKNGTILYEANVSLALALEGGNLQVHSCK